MIDHIHKTEGHRTAASSSTSATTTTTSFIDSNPNGSRNLDDTQQNIDYRNPNISSQSLTPSTATTISSVLPPYSSSQSSISVSSSPKYSSLSRSQLSPPSRPQVFPPSQAQQEKQISQIQQQKQTSQIQQQQQQQTSQQQQLLHHHQQPTPPTTGTHAPLCASLPPKPPKVGTSWIPNGTRNTKILFQETSKVVKPPHPHRRRLARTLAKFIKESNTKENDDDSDSSLSFIEYASIPNLNSNSNPKPNQDATNGEQIIKNELSIPDEFKPAGFCNVGIDTVFVHDDVKHEMRGRGQ
ncbi:unnamed protein product [Ambrosiozyma monospora]|uniref:Unnamed protein product n=1 Tax=Ambrosiozyma monospora TaxID=43982 RepID=A0A9W6W9X0_AMBMO|nr:unnamed protein product [Ambrosiozyma monospora]